MKKSFFIIFSVVTVCFTGCKQQEQNTTESYVEVMGEASEEVAPDIFHLNFTLGESSSKANNVSALEQKIIAALQSLNIDTKSALTVTSLSGDNWYWWRKSRNVYQNKSYSLKIGSLDTLNAVCDKLDAIGYNSYYLGKTESSKAEEWKKEIEQKAVKAAREKAENLLAGEGRQVDELIYLKEQEITQNRVYYQYGYDYDKSENKEIASSPVDFKKIKISYRVIARFSIK